jgi:hypothetical protein
MHAKSTPCRIPMLACALALALPGAVFAEGSEKATPLDEQKQQLAEADLPDAVKLYISYMQDFDARYPDSALVDTTQVIAEEGEIMASLYCNAIGINGPCAPDSTTGDFVAVGADATARLGDGKWWVWLENVAYNIGVIPEVKACPAPSQLVVMAMDDENRNNINSRGGWIGATGSTADTIWRYCRLDYASSMQFRPLPQTGADYNYAVQNMGVFCPPGATRTGRFHDNQGGSNNNYSTGTVFPSINVLGRNWLTYTCHFRGGNASAGTMSAFPNLGMKYGLFASQYMPAGYALQSGRVYQDDEDFNNVNLWINLPSNSAMFMGLTNTLRYLVRVQ